jgi:DNA-binding response OmpR family regulator
MDVLLVQWPEEEPQRAAAAAAGRPRLLVVPENQPPPLVADDLEDWVRSSAAEADVEARVRTVLARARAKRRVVPSLQDDVLSFCGRSVTLAPLDARLVEALIQRYAAVVSRDAMFAAGWPGETPHRNVLDVHLLRLRRRIAPLGLTVKTVRARGYLLQPEEQIAVRERS